MKIAGSAAFLAAALGLTLSFPSVAGAQNSDLSFDQGVSASDILRQARGAAHRGVPIITDFYSGGTRYDQDCVTFTFGPDDKPVSDPVMLRSTEWVTECQNIPGGVVPGPGGHPMPIPGGQQCWDRPDYTYNKMAQVILRDRQQLFPWEYDSFNVCLSGPWLNLSSIATSHEYKVAQGGGTDGRFVLTAVKKIAMKPDPAGITAQGLSPQMTLTLQDKWASYYAGEQTVLRLLLREEALFDSTVLDNTLPPSETYVVNFQDYAAQFVQKMHAGRKYYVQYFFQRLGKISRQDFVKVGNTDHVRYQPATSALAQD